MKRTFFYILLCMVFSTCAFAQKKQADIKFNTTSHNFGEFSEKEPVKTFTFVFTNVGDGPLVVHQAVASCGCTVPEFTQEPVLPGKTGTIKVTYNGEGRFPGYFKKSITLRTNAKVEMMRLYIEGDMKKEGEPDTSVN